MTGAQHPACPPEDDLARFSDEQLQKLRKDFDEHVAEQDARWQQVMEAVDRNAAATQSLAESCESMARNTEGVVQLYKDMQGAARIGSALQRFIVWVAKWGAIGGGLAAGLSWLLDNFMPPPGA